MIQELIYTSAPSGLKPGSRGYCTVASSAGMSKPMSEKLESLSGYRHMFPPGTIQADNNPVAQSYVRCQIGGQSAHILSRVADAGLDYSGRSNKLAHHVVFTKDDLVDSGPAACLGSHGFSVKTWATDPKVLTPRVAPNLAEAPPSDRQLWKQLAGDADWCDYLVHNVRQKKPVYVVFPLGTNVIGLLAEAQSHMLPDERWQMTFSTYFTRMPQGVECQVRCIPAGTKEANAILARHDQIRIDLTSPAIAPKSFPRLSASSSVAAVTTPAAKARPEKAGATAATTDEFGDELRVAPPELPSAAGGPKIRTRGDQRKSSLPFWLAMSVVGMLAIGSAAGFLVWRNGNKATDIANNSTPSNTQNEQQSPQTETPTETPPDVKPSDTSPTPPGQVPTEDIPSGPGEPKAPTGTIPTATKESSDPPAIPTKEHSKTNSKKAPIHWVLDATTQPTVTSSGIANVSIHPQDDTASVEKTSDGWVVRGLDESGFEATYFQAYVDGTTNNLKVEKANEGRIVSMLPRTARIELVDGQNVFVHSQPELHIKIEGFKAKTFAKFEIDTSTVPNLDTVKCAVKVKANGKTTQSDIVLRQGENTFGAQFAIADQYELQLAISEEKQLGVISPVLAYAGDYQSFAKMLGKKEKMRPLFNAIRDGSDLRDELKTIFEICAKPAVKEKNFSPEQKKKIRNAAKQILADLKLIEVGEPQYMITRHLSGEKKSQAALKILAASKEELTKPPLNMIDSLKGFDDFLRGTMKAWKSDGAYDAELYKQVTEAEKLKDLDVDIVFYKTKETGGRFRFLRISTSEEVSPR